MVPMVMFPLMLILLTAFFSFDSLVKLQHDRYPDAWKADGSPWGFLLAAARGWVRGCLLARMVVDEVGLRDAGVGARR